MSRRGENIRKRKDGRWEGRYYVQQTETGKMIQRSVYAKSYGEVRKKLCAVKLENKQTTKGDNLDVCFNKAAEEWFAIVRNEKKHSTYIKYRYIYETYLSSKLGNTVFSEWNYDFIADLFKSKENRMCSDSVQKSIYCVLNQIASHAGFHSLSRPVSHSVKYKTVKNLWKF